MHRLLSFVILVAALIALAVAMVKMLFDPRFAINSILLVGVLSSGTTILLGVKLFLDLLAEEA